MMPFSGGFFPGGMESTENGLVIFSFAAAFLYLLMVHRAAAPRRTLVKAAAVGLLAALAYIAQAPDLLVAALAFSAVGDAALAQENDQGFLVGLGAFLLAHIAYAVLFFGLGGPVEPADWPGLAAVALFAVGFGAVMVRAAGKLALPVAAYVLAIAAMGAGAVTLGGWVLLGAALFMASDALLGLDRFMLPPASPLKPAMRVAVWVLYWLGQAIIAISLVRLALLD